MAIFRDLDESENIVEPSTCDVHISMWNHSYKNVKHSDGEIDYKLVKLSMLDICESSSSFASDNINDNDNEPFYLLSRETQS